ncbi:hypothetical protein P9112_009406 [Eukaryota sp. TZLM1-RC]
MLLDFNIPNLAYAPSVKHLLASSKSEDHSTILADICRYLLSRFKENLLTPKEEQTYTTDLHHWLEQLSTSSKPHIVAPLLNLYHDVHGPSLHLSSITSSFLKSHPSFLSARTLLLECLLTQNLQDFYSLFEQSQTFLRCTNSTLYYRRLLNGLKTQLNHSHEVTRHHFDLVMTFLLTSVDFCLCCFWSSFTSEIQDPEFNYNTAVLFFHEIVTSSSQYIDRFGHILSGSSRKILTFYLHSFLIYLDFFTMISVFQNFERDRNAKFSVLPSLISSICHKLVTFPKILQNWQHSSSKFTFLPPYLLNCRVFSILLYFFTVNSKYLSTLDWDNSRLITDLHDYEFLTGILNLETEQIDDLPFVDYTPITIDLIIQSITDSSLVFSDLMTLSQSSLTSVVFQNYLYLSNSFILKPKSFRKVTSIVNKCFGSFPSQLTVRLVFQTIRNLLKNCGIDSYSRAVVGTLFAIQYSKIFGLFPSKFEKLALWFVSSTDKLKISLLSSFEPQRLFLLGSYLYSIDIFSYGRLCLEAIINLISFRPNTNKFGLARNSFEYLLDSNYFYSANSFINGSFVSSQFNSPSSSSISPNFTPNQFRDSFTGNFKSNRSSVLELIRKYRFSKIFNPITQHSAPVCLAFCYCLDSFRSDFDLKNMGLINNYLTTLLELLANDGFGFLNEREWEILNQLIESNSKSVVYSSTSPFFSHQNSPKANPNPNTNRIPFEKKSAVSESPLYGYLHSDRGSEAISSPLVLKDLESEESDGSDSENFNPDGTPKIGIPDQKFKKIIPQCNEIIFGYSDVEGDSVNTPDQDQPDFQSILSALNNHVNDSFKDEEIEQSSDIVVDFNGENLVNSGQESLEDSEQDEKSDVEFFDDEKNFDASTVLAVQSQEEINQSDSENLNGILNTGVPEAVPSIEIVVDESDQFEENHGANDTLNDLIHEEEITSQKSGDKFSKEHLGSMTEQLNMEISDLEANITIQSQGVDISSICTGQSETVEKDHYSEVTEQDLPEEINQSNRQNFDDISVVHPDKQESIGDEEINQSNRENFDDVSVVHPDKQESIVDEEINQSNRENFDDVSVVHPDKQESIVDEEINQSNRENFDGENEESNVESSVSIEIVGLARSSGDEQPTDIVNSGQESLEDSEQDEKSDVEFFDDEKNFDASTVLAVQSQEEINQSDSENLNGILNTGVPEAVPSIEIVVDESDQFEENHGANDTLNDLIHEEEITSQKSGDKFSKEHLGSMAEQLNMEISDFEANITIQSQGVDISSICTGQSETVEEDHYSEVTEQDLPEEINQSNRQNFDDISVVHPDKEESIGDEEINQSNRENFDDVSVVHPDKQESIVDEEINQSYRENFDGENEESNVESSVSIEIVGLARSSGDEQPTDIVNSGQESLEDSEQDEKSDVEFFDDEKNFDASTVLAVQSQEEINQSDSENFNGILNTGVPEAVPSIEIVVDESDQFEENHGANDTLNDLIHEEEITSQKSGDKFSKEHLGSMAEQLNMEISDLEANITIQSQGVDTSSICTGQSETVEKDHYSEVTEQDLPEEINQSNRENFDDVSVVHPDKQESIVDEEINQSNRENFDDVSVVHPDKQESIVDEEINQSYRENFDDVSVVHPDKQESIVDEEINQSYRENFDDVSVVHPDKQESIVDEEINQSYRENFDDVSVVHPDKQESIVDEEINQSNRENFDDVSVVHPDKQESIVDEEINQSNRENFDDVSVVHPDKQESIVDEEINQSNRENFDGENEESSNECSDQSHTKQSLFINGSCRSKGNGCSQSKHKPSKRSQPKNKKVKFGGKRKKK